MKMRRYRYFGAYVVTLAVTTFILHFIWESFHVSLYGGYENLSPYLPITLWATLGDVLYTFGAFLLWFVVRKRVAFTNAARGADYFFFVLAGFAIALFVEYKALTLGSWYYLPEMPIIPFLKVGLTPVLQMTILLPLSIFITEKIMAWRRSRLF